MTGEIVSLGGGNVNNRIPEFAGEDGETKRIEIGMFVHYWHESSIKYVIDDVEHHMIRFSDIWAVV